MKQQSIYPPERSSPGSIALPPFPLYLLGFPTEVDGGFEDLQAAEDLGDSEDL